jgi:nitroreductase
MRFTDEIRPARPAFPAWAGPAERLRFLIGYAIQAPSRHNTQPWLFEIEGDELRVFTDPRRMLRSADPHGREMVMACGAAIENIVVAAAHHGHSVQVEGMAAARADNLVARLRLGERLHPTAEGEELYRAISLRRTAAGALSPEPVPVEVVAAMLREAGSSCRARVVPPWLAWPVAELVAEADAVQWASPRHRSELAAWTRQKARRAVDGLAEGRQGPRAPAGLLRRLLRRAGGADRDLSRRCAEQTRTMMVLSTRGDRTADWLEAGRAMQRLLLRASAEGLVASYFSQAVEVPDVRLRLGRTLGEAGHPQLLFRVGYGPAPRPTARRPVELVLRSMTTEVAVDVALDEPGQQAG